ARSARLLYSAARSYRVARHRRATAMCRSSSRALSFRRDGFALSLRPCPLQSGMAIGIDAPLAQYVADAREAVDRRRPEQQADADHQDLVEDQAGETGFRPDPHDGVLGHDDG